MHAFNLTMMYFETVFTDPHRPIEAFAARVWHIVRNLSSAASVLLNRCLAHHMST